jgi:hypothetical protein
MARDGSKRDQPVAGWGGDEEPSSPIRHRSSAIAFLVFAHSTVARQKNAFK